MFISASVALPDQIKGLKLGAVDFVHKPFQNAEVLARVQTHLELSRLRTRLQNEVEERTRELSQALRRLETELAERELHELERQTFYRETIQSATDGKLRICDEVDVEDYLAAAQVNIVINGSASLSGIRGRIRSFFNEHGFENDQPDDMILAFGEVLDNAVKHCGGGRVSAGADSESVWVAVSDDGPGIDALVLPKATLRRRFSTRNSMGFGYSMVLEMADQVLLATSKSGTTVIVIKNIRTEETITLESLPDTWDSIPDLSQTD